MKKTAIDPRGLGLLIDIMLGKSPSLSIERQEAEGQRRLIATEQLPRELHGCHRWELEQLGFKFGREISELFIEAQLPAGWNKMATSHSMHSDILDEKGRRRAAIFYKAAFYDERADMTMLPRFSISAYERTDDGNGYQMVIKDAGLAVKSFGVWGNPGPDRSRDEILAQGEARDKLEAEAKAWLKKRRPLWSNPMLYWSEGPVA